MDYTIRSGIDAAAAELGISAVDLATVISYETAGTLNPLKKGPTTQWGQHRGLIQFGEPQAKQFGVDFSNKQSAINSQLGPNGAVVKYLKSKGVEPGMGLLELYSAINAGGIGEKYYGRTDENNNGAPGTVREKVINMGDHRASAVRKLGYSDSSPNMKVFGAEQSVIGKSPMDSNPSIPYYTGTTANIPYNSEAEVVPPTNFPARNDFSSTFARARANAGGGGGTFVWQGKEYTTDYANEARPQVTQEVPQVRPQARPESFVQAVPQVRPQARPEVPQQAVNQALQEAAVNQAIQDNQVRMYADGTGYVPNPEDILMSQPVTAAVPQMPFDPAYNLNISDYQRSSVPEIPQAIPAQLNEDTIPMNAMELMSQQAIGVYGPSTRGGPAARKTADAEEFARSLDPFGGRTAMAQPVAQVAPETPVLTEQDMLREANLQYLNEQLDDLNKRIVFMPSGSEGRAILQTQIDRIKGEIIGYGGTPEFNIPEAKQTGVNVNLITANNDLRKAETELRTAKTSDEIASAAAKVAAAKDAVNNSQTIPDLSQSITTAEDIKSVTDGNAMITEIDNQISNTVDPSLINALNRKKERIQADIDAAQTNLDNEELGAGRTIQDAVTPMQADEDTAMAQPVPQVAQVDPETPDNTGVDPRGSMTEEQVEVAAINASEGVAPEIKESLFKKFADIFGLETKDLTRALGYYLMSRATGASHAGSMKWAGVTVLKQAESRDTLANETKAEKAKMEAAAKVLLASGYTPASVASYTATGIASVLDKPGPDYTNKQLKDKYAELLAAGKFTDKSLQASFSTVPGQFNPGFLVLKGGNGKTNAENSQLLIKDLKANFDAMVDAAFEDKEQGAIFKSDMMTSAEAYWVSSGIPIGDEAVGSHIKRVTTLAMQAAMADSKKNGTTVKDITPYIKNMSLDEYAQSGTDSIWSIGSTGKVDAAKVAVLREDMYSKSGADTEVMKGAFLAAVDEFNNLSPSQLARLKPAKGENKFYVYLREKLAGL